MATFSISKNDRWPPLPSIAELVKVEVDKANYIAQATMLAGFDYEFHGVTYHFSYESEDQINFATMTTAANTSQALGAMSEEELKKTYGTTVDGALDTSKLPQPLPDDWIAMWQGHVGDKSISLTFTLQEWLKLAVAAGEHNMKTLAECRLMKEKLNSVKTEAELKKLVKSLDLDQRVVKARDYLDSVRGKLDSIIA